jgi:hypothetical protein
MISDVLSEAADDIRNYMQRLPKTYKDVKPRLDQLLTDMDGIRSELDTPPAAPKD